MGTQTSRCYSPVARCREGEAHPVAGARGRSCQLPAMISSLAVSRTPPHGDKRSVYPSRLHRLEVRVAPCWQELAGWTPDSPGDDASLQLSPLTPSPDGVRMRSPRSTKSLLSGGPSSLSSLPSPLRSCGSGGPCASARTPVAAGASSEGGMAAPLRGTGTGSAASDDSLLGTPLLNALQLRAAVLSQRLLLRERQCLALREALDHCGGARLKENRDLGYRSGEADSKGGPLSRGTPCRTPLAPRENLC